MILTRELNADVVIIDDLAARNTAEYDRLPVTGTLGVLIKAKKNGLIEEVMPVIREMQHQHICFSESLIALIRKKPVNDLRRMNRYGSMRPYDILFEKV